jgi:SAM-dependent methyltransferase
MLTREGSIIELGAWLNTPAGRVLSTWEQRRLDAAVTDAFGFHALQLGLPGIEGLRANRMPHRWVATETLAPCEPLTLPPLRDGLTTLPPPTEPVALHCAFDALPFPDASIDLVVLPHALETAADPHATLREVERVLVPEGRVVVTGFNPASLWGLRQRAGRVKRGIGFGRHKGLYLPRAGEFIGYWRLRDWLRLLNFQLEGGRFGCYRPPLVTERWLERWGWMDRVGERWWPVLGASYVLIGVKRVRGMRLVGLVKHERVKKKAAAAVVANREPAETMRNAEIEA